ncbi:MAG: YdcF family protein, partial [Alphaproteobacteria bacterium]|nr:YdcF family protein [Alphaproteobacteria bacterium]
GRAGLARGLVIFTLLALTALATMPLAPLVAKPLEDAYPRPSRPPAHVDGIVVLSSGVRTGIAWSRGTLSDSSTNLRMAAAADLVRHYPGAKLIFSGTSGGTAAQRAYEFEVVEDIFRGLGLAPGRALYEKDSRDTWENLVFSKRMARPKSGETWLLVTSATHMRRAMGIARRIGWTMMPWPSDYDSASDLRYQPRSFASDDLLILTRALHEWVALAVYWMRGRLA